MVWEGTIIFMSFILCGPPNINKEKDSVESAAVFRFAGSSPSANFFDFVGINASIYIYIYIDGFK